MSTRLRLWTMAGGIGCLVLLVLGWLVVVQPQLWHADSTRSSASDLAAANDATASRVAALKAQDAQFTQLQQQAIAAERQLPVQAQVDSFTTQLSGAAAASHVTLTSVAATAPTLQAANGKSTKSAGTKVVAGGLYAIPVTVVASGRLIDLQGFLAHVQHDQRAVLVEKVAVATAASGTTGTPDLVTMTITLDAFARPSA